MDNLEKTLSSCEALARSGASVEEILKCMRDAGINKVLSVLLLSRLGIANMQEAKLIVHNSAVWQDLKNRDEQFEDDVLRAVKEVSRRGGSDTKE
ncbi:hypothetical protein [Hyphomicrobium sp. ghe19]|uniref:hypothetical protein n=1 Tax=Hyphomicrobium sp. ghe19 TaxID=2682968 RepID=UPI001366BA4C|nr:hypothetical protein HYPP_03209 [Hyphomicrobium sp. ghe19]